MNRNQKLNQKSEEKKVVEVPVNPEENNKEDKPMKEKHGVAKKIGRGIGSAFNWMRDFPDRHPRVCNVLETTAMAFGVCAGTMAGAYGAAKFIDVATEKKRSKYTSMPIPTDSNSSLTSADPAIEIDVKPAETADLGTQTMENN